MSQQWRQYFHRTDSVITYTPDTYALLRTTTKQCRADDGWQDEHITELKNTRRYFERKCRHSANNSYKRIYRFLCWTTNAAITAKHKQYYAEKLNITEGTSLPWKQAQRLLFGPAESIVSLSTDTCMLSQNLPSFFTGKVEKLSFNLTTLLTNMQLSSKPLD